jgi:ribonuclease D
VKRGLALPTEDIPKLQINEPLPPTAAAVADLLRVLLKSVSARSDVAAKLIATSDDLDRIALDDEADVPALTGWRRELFGADALALKRGEVALAVERGEIVTVPRAVKAPDAQNRPRLREAKAAGDPIPFEDAPLRQSAKP